MLCPCSEPVHRADVLSSSAHHVRRPTTRRKSKALYLDLPSQPELEDRPALCDLSRIGIKHKNAWTDIPEPKTHITSFAVRYHHIATIFAAQSQFIYICFCVALWLHRDRPQAVMGALRLNGVSDKMRLIYSSLHSFLNSIRVSIMPQAPDRLHHRFNRRCSALRAVNRLLIYSQTNYNFSNLGYISKRRFLVRKKIFNEKIKSTAVQKWL